MLSIVKDEELSSEETDNFSYFLEEYELKEYEQSFADGDQSIIKRIKGLPCKISPVISSPIENDSSLVWQEVTGQNLKTFQFTVNNAGVSRHLFDSATEQPPIYFFKLFLDDDLLGTMVNETNIYAKQKKESTKFLSARINQWKDTNLQEMAQFLGLQIWMGLVRVPKLSDYWSKRTIYSNKTSNLMSRNRFELLLAHWHFANNERVDTGNGLYKVAPIVESLAANFKKYFVPQERLCIDHTLVSFQGEQEHIKQHTFGVNLFKLCLNGGYTYDCRIHCGGEYSEKTSVPTGVVLTLCDSLLDSGRTIYADSNFTSVELAHKLLERKTHLVGLLRAKRNNNPLKVINKKLRRGDCYSQESNTGIVVTKWQDSSEVLTLSTKHFGDKIKETSEGITKLEKPDSLVEFSTCKAFIDMSDPSKASPSLRKGIKWYRKLATDLLLGSSMVNAFLLYKNVTKNNISITQFREEVAESLLSLPEQKNEQAAENPQRHYLQDMGTGKRRRCVICYAKISLESGRDVAVRKAYLSRWGCIQCQKHYCIPCFCDSHKCASTR